MGLQEEIKDHKKKLVESAEVVRAAEDELRAVKVKACETERELEAASQQLAAQEVALQKSCDEGELLAKELHEVKKEKNSLAEELASAKLQLKKMKKVGFLRRLFKKF